MIPEKEDPESPLAICMRVEQIANGEFTAGSFASTNASPWISLGNKSPCSWGPGLLSTALIVLLTWTPPFPAWRVVRLAAFVAAGVSISVLAEILHAAERRADASH